MINDATDLINQIVSDFNRGYEQGKKDAVVHAHWIISSDGYYPYCSRCKAEPKGGISHYCPECGAEMNEGDDLFNTVQTNEAKA